MILVDYSGVAISALFANGINEENEIDENMIRHIILNTLRSYNVKFKGEYGQMVLAMDAGEVWRRDIFPQYKANRKSGREKSDLDWGKIFEVLNKVSKEIRQFIPWAGVKVHKCEADDIIAVLTKEYCKLEKILIISGDKDFLQLQKHQNVKQWAPQFDQFKVEKDPRGYIFEHVVRGDSGDGVPNILSDDTCLVEGRRQKSVFKKRLEKWQSEGFTDLTDEQQANFKRNQVMIDFEYIPDDIQDMIIEAWKNLKIPKGEKLMDYFIEKKSRTLLDKLPDFQPAKFERPSTLF